MHGEPLGVTHYLVVKAMQGVGVYKISNPNPPWNSQRFSASICCVHHFSISHHIAKLDSFVLCIPVALRLLTSVQRLSMFIQAETTILVALSHSVLGDSLKVFHVRSSTFTNCIHCDKRRHLLMWPWDLMMGLMKGAIVLLLHSVFTDIIIFLRSVNKSSVALTCDLSVINYMFCL